MSPVTALCCPCNPASPVITAFWLFYHPNACSCSPLLFFHKCCFGLVTCWFLLCPVQYLTNCPLKNWGCLTCRISPSLFPVGYLLVVPSACSRSVARSRDSIRPRPSSLETQGGPEGPVLCVILALAGIYCLLICSFLRACRVPVFWSTHSFSFIN